MKQQSAAILVAIAAFGAIALTIALGVHGLQERQAARAIAALPVVRLEPVVIVGERAQAARSGTRIANTPTPLVR